jgi:glyoxylase-like metal-dependent hydrolase (beta-lactamase superfamily II)
MRILSHTGGIASTNCYLVVDDATKQCVLFDAPDHTVGPILDHVQKEKLELIGLWLTHGHFDHLADHQLVRDRFPAAQVLMHKLDEPKMLRPGSAMFTLPFKIPPGTVDRFIAEGDTLAIGSLRVNVLFTPGHSPGHVSFHLPDEKVLIGGDLIIGGAVGRTDLPDSDESALIESVRRVMKLPGDTTLLPGHGGPSTLDDERRTNDYVRQFLR